MKEEIRKPQFSREQIQFYTLQFRKVDLNTLEGRRRLIDGVVNSVVVYDDYLLVTFNYKEGAEQITFDQIERSDLSSLGGPDRRFQALGFGIGGFLFGVFGKREKAGYAACLFCVFRGPLQWIGKLSCPRSSGDIPGPIWGL